MTVVVTKARLPIEDGVGTVALTIYSSSNLSTPSVARSTSSISQMVVGDGWGEYAKTVTLPSGVTQGVFVWDDGSGNSTSEAFNIISSGGSGDSGTAQSGGGILNGRIAYSSLAPDEFLEVIQGEEKILTFIVEADGRFDQTEADSISVKLKDPDGNVVTKNNSDITRITQELDVQIFRTTLEVDDTDLLQEGLLRIEIAFDTQKCVLTHTLKLLGAL